MTGLQRTRRIWILDRHADVLNAAARENLGAWIRGRLKHGVEVRERVAGEELLKVGISVSELRQQWTEQRTAQLSVRNRRYICSAALPLLTYHRASQTPQPRLNEI